MRKLIAGPDDTFICDECIGLCSEIINEELKQPYDEALAGEINLLKPQEIKEILDEYVIGQDEAKKCFLLRYTIIIKESFPEEIQM